MIPFSKIPGNLRVPLFHSELFINGGSFPTSDQAGGVWTVESNIIVNAGSAHYTAQKSNGIAVFDSYADLDLTSPIILSLSDSEYRNNPGVDSAISGLIGSGVAYTWDDENARISYVKQGVYDVVTYNSPNFHIWALNCTILEACQQFGRTFYPDENHYTVEFQGKIYTFVGYGFSGSSGAGIFVGDLIPDFQAYVSFEQIAEQIISNSDSEDAQEYLSLVANSIFNADESKQFVKLSELIDQLEENKVLHSQ